MDKATKAKIDNMVETGDYSDWIQTVSQQELIDYVAETLAEIEIELE